MGLIRTALSLLVSVLIIIVIFKVLLFFNIDIVEILRNLAERIWAS